MLLVLLFFFGKTVPEKTNSPAKPPMATAGASAAMPAASTADVVGAAKKKLTQAQAARVLQLENSVVRGDVKAQQVKVFKQLANFWGDTLAQASIGAFYFGEAAKLENNEKNLTFAAHLLLDNAMAETNPTMQTWEGTQAKALFEKALQINPANDSSKVGLGACYLFGNISAAPMQGIMAIREVVERDSNNIYAQMTLGLGGIKSGQIDKAIERFQFVLRRQPNNLEAIFNLGEAYDRKGDKENAIKWYKAALALVQVPEAKKELEERIKALQ